MWGWIFWQGLETIRAGKPSGARSTGQPGVKRSPAVLPSPEKQDRFPSDSVGPDLGSSRVNTDPSVPWDCSLGQGDLPKTQGFGPSL